jgi:hypothetical protein
LGELDEVVTIPDDDGGAFGRARERRHEKAAPASAAKPRSLNMSGPLVFRDSPP